MKMIRILAAHKYSNRFASSLDKALPVFDISDDHREFELVSMHLVFITITFEVIASFH